MRRPPPALTRLPRSAARLDSAWQIEESGLKSGDRMAMVQTRVELRPVGLLGIIALSLLVPACSSPGGPQYPWLRQSNPDPYVVQRPIIDFSRERVFFLSGYAGTDYGPDVRARPAWAFPGGTRAASRATGHGQPGDVGAGVTGSTGWLARLVCSGDSNALESSPTGRRQQSQGMCPLSHRLQRPDSLESGDSEAQNIS